MANFDWEIQNQEDFQRGLDRLGRATNDFRIPFRLIASDFYRSQRKLFTLQNKGLYDDFGGREPQSTVTVKGISVTRRTRAKFMKKRKVGFIYPLLVGETRDLSNSTLGKNHKHSVFFLGRQELQMGTKDPKAKFHQEGTKYMPQRKIIFIDGGPADRSQDSSISGRRERWLNIMNDHVLQLITGEVL